MLVAVKQSQFCYYCKHKLLFFFNKNPLSSFIALAFIFGTILLEKEEKNTTQIIGN